MTGFEKFGMVVLCLTVIADRKFSAIVFPNFLGCLFLFQIHPTYDNQVFRKSAGL